MIHYLQSVNREFNRLQLACDKCNNTLLEMRAKPTLTLHEKRVVKDAQQRRYMYMHSIEQRQAMMRFLHTRELDTVEKFTLTWGGASDRLLLMGDAAVMSRMATLLAAKTTA
jgi:hypothetical protein